MSLIDGGVLLDQGMARIAGMFGRVETRATARAYLLGLLSATERKNCWQLAEHTGHRRPGPMQRLLRSARWDAAAARDEVRLAVGAPARRNTAHGRASTPGFGSRRTGGDSRHGPLSAFVTGIPARGGPGCRWSSGRKTTTGGRTSRCCCRTARRSRWRRPGSSHCRCPRPRGDRPHKTSASDGPRHSARPGALPSRTAPGTARPNGPAARPKNERLRQVPQPVTIRRSSCQHALTINRSISTGPAEPTCLSAASTTPAIPATGSPYSCHMAISSGEVGTERPRGCCSPALHERGHTAPLHRRSGSDGPARVRHG